MFNTVIEWLKDTFVESDYQNLTKDLKWVNQRDLICKGFAFRKRGSYVDEKCHTYLDSATYFKVGPNGEPNDYHVVATKAWVSRIITYIKGTPKCLRNLLSFKKSYINVSAVYNGRVCDITGPYCAQSLEVSWLRFKYSKIFIEFIEGMVNGL